MPHGKLDKKFALGTHSLLHLYGQRTEVTRVTKGLPPGYVINSTETTISLRRITFLRARAITRRTPTDSRQPIFMALDVVEVRNSNHRPLGEQKMLFEVGYVLSGGPDVDSIAVVRVETVFLQTRS